METRTLAKLFKLRSDGQWDEKYIGDVDLVNYEDDDDLYLVVYDVEDSSHILYKSKVFKSTEYTKSSEAILMWKDKDEDEEYEEVALSFKSSLNRDTIFDTIVAHQQDMPTEESITTSVNSNMSLPDISTTSSTEIYKQIANSNVQFLNMSLLSNKGQFLHDLCGQLPILEEHEDILNLQMYAEIIKLIMLLNSSNIVSILFSDELYLSLFGIMEYNKDLATKGNFREFFKTKVMYKKVLDIKDQHILDLIHQNYRISYYRNAINPQPKDDMSNDYLQDIIISNNKVIIDHIIDHQEYFQELFKLLEDVDEKNAQSLNYALGLIEEIYYNVRSALRLAVSIDQLINYTCFDNDNLFKHFIKLLGNPAINTYQRRLMYADHQKWSDTT